MIYEVEGFVQKSELSHYAKTMFEMTLGQALVFRYADDAEISHNILKLAMQNLKMLLKYLIENDATDSD